MTREVAMMIVSLWATATGAQALVERRLPVTSLEVERQTPLPPPPPAAANSAATSVKKPTPDELSIGPRENLRVRFQLSADIDPKSVSREPMRLGLFLKREQNAVASVQRGTLVSCSGRFCLGSFAGNADLQFYAADLKSPDKWFVQLLQNPVLEERLLETEGAGRDKKGTFDFERVDLGIYYGIQSVTLSESSSSVFNSAKESRRLNFGAVLNLDLTLDAWELRLTRFRSRLDTQGFYIDNFLTDVTDFQTALVYNFRLGEHWGLGLGAGRTTFAFRTTNDDEAILSSDYAAWTGELRLRYFTPWVLARFRGGRDVLDVGQGRLTFAQGFLGRAKDTGEFKRGDKASWKTWRLSYDHLFEVRSTMLWLNKLRLGVGAEFKKNSDAFSGDPDGPYGGLPESTRSSGHQLSWKAYLGREFSFK